MNGTLRSLALAGSIALAFTSISATSLAADSKLQNATTSEIADARREAQIQTGFTMNRHLHPFALTVLVDGNKAVLDGSVEDSVTKDLAEQIALGADGIAHVDNRIVVNPDYVRYERTASERSFSEKVGDATITASIKSKLLWNAHTDGLDIRVDTNNGKVVLTGTVSDAAERELAVRMAKDTDGVISLRNDIVVTEEPRMTPATQAAAPLRSDAWISAKVKSSLMFTRGVDGFGITVETLNGVVSLYGVVDSTAERELAMRVTSDIRGVKKVEAMGLKVG